MTYRELNNGFDQGRFSSAVGWVIHQGQVLAEGGERIDVLRQSFKNHATCSVEMLQDGRFVSSF